MEQLKPYLDGIAKHHFWILTVVLVLAVLYCWNSAVTDVQTQFEENQRKVDSEFQRMQTLARRPEFPNTDWKDETNEKTKAVVQEVTKASQAIVRAQQTAALRWEGFPPEFATTPAADWTDEMLDEFALQMPEEINRLKQVMGAADGPNQPGVQWDAENFGFIQNAFAWEEPPAKDKVMAWRHAFWAYENLAKIIKETNETAKKTNEYDPYNFPVHTVQQLEIGGRSALDGEAWQTVGGEPVKRKFAAPTVAGYETKQVRMRVRMNIKKLSWLLAACANSELPFDLLGVRFEKPRRLDEVEEEKEDRSRNRASGGRPRFFGARPIQAPKQEKEKEEEEEKPEYGRGTLVEIYGILYIAKETEFDKKLVAVPQTSKAALAQR